MNSLGHTQFIMTPIANILKETDRACVCLGDGIESYPMASYVLQTTFLRLTGASEQKLKCICWEIASFDYESRYEMLQKPLGECSSYDDKQKKFSWICKFLKKHDINCELSKEEKKEILEAATTGLLETLEKSHLSLWLQKEMSEFRNSKPIGKLKTTSFCSVGKKNTLSLLEEEAQDYYTDYVYRNRNRYAHNLTSYQMNVPTLTQLSKMDSDKNNLFRMFSHLILLDGIFMKYFEKFQSIKLHHSY